MYCLHQHKDDPRGLQENLLLIVPHAFGHHENCQSWCGYLKNPTSYVHKDLPGGKNLSGEDLKAAINDCLEPFTSTETTNKLAHLGSSQANESFNNMVGSKAPKIRHYGSSESQDFRVAASVSQFNDGLCYLENVAQSLHLSEKQAMHSYITTGDKKRQADKQRKSTRKFKRRRTELKKTKLRKKETKEQKEGTTYESAVGISASVPQVTSAMIKALALTLTQDEYEETVEIAVVQQQNVTSTMELNIQSIKEDDKAIFVLDLETTGLERCSDITQLSCLSVDKSQSVCCYMLPKKDIKPSASKITGLSTTYRNGQKILLKNNQEVPVHSFIICIQQLITMFKKAMDQGKTPVIIAHNGFKFDFPVLANSLKRFNLLEYFLEVPCLFVDSLVLLRQQSKQKECPIRNCKSKNITTLYRFLFDKEFSGHDATEDVKALISILYDSRLTVTHTEVLSLAKEFKDFAHDEAACKIRKVIGMELMQIGLSSSMSDKIVDSGMTYGRLKDVYRQKRLRGLLTALALPVSFQRMKDQKAKPRVTRHIKTLSTIITHFKQ